MANAKIIAETANGGTIHDDKNLLYKWEKSV